MATETKYEHTEKISVRRKALFPCEENGDDAENDLGMCPLASDSSNLSDELETGKGNEMYRGSGKTFFDFIRSSITEYVLEDDTPSTPSVKFSSPLAVSPTSTLKTPHDTSTVKMNLKQPKRKAAEIDEVDLVQREKIAKIDKPKARTSLFADDVVSTKSFYPKNQGVYARSSLTYAPTVKQLRNKENISYLCGRNKKKYGMINAGVRHRIRKPKIKKVARAAIFKAALNIIDKSPLNEYLQEMTSNPNALSPKQILKMDDLLKNLKKPKDEMVDVVDLEPPPTIDSTKKFFKSSRTQGIVTLNKNLKVKIQDGKYNLIKKPNPFEATEKDIKSDIENILRKLEDDPKEMLLSPTSQMCDMASGLAINSPKRGKINLNTILDQVDVNQTASVVDKKLFPVFYGKGSGHVSNNTSRKETHKRNVKKWHKIPAGQMLLDAGQKRFGPEQCNECQMVYEAGNPNEELSHLNYHNSIRTLRHNGWKNERVVGDLTDARIIKVMPGDSKIWWKKIREIVDVVNRDLGFYEATLPVDHSQVFLYIKNKCIVGCLVSEPKTTAYRMLQTGTGVDMCSEESFPVKCGVSRIWVSQQHRKTNVATSLMNCLRANFQFGACLALPDIAFSSPTEMGKAFAVKYFRTENFFVYF